MRQITIPRHGDPSVLVVREAEDPEPGPGEVRIRVAFSGVNYADVLSRIGMYANAPPLPAVVGFEVSGTVDKVGPGLPRYAVGERVIALTQFGGYSDVVIAPEIQIARLPAHVSLEKGAALPVNFLTAWLCLVKLGNIQPKERVLIHAAGGGVGLAAVQLARWKGAEIIGVAGSTKHDRLRALGVAHCIDSRNGDFEAEVLRITSDQGVDLAMDSNAGNSFRKSYRCLRPLGRLFMMGVADLAPKGKRSIPSAVRSLIELPWFHPLALMNGNRGVFGLNLGNLWDTLPRMDGVMDQLIDLMAQGVVDPVIDSIHPFDRASEAHLRIQSRESFGKLLLTAAHA